MQNNSSRHFIEFGPSIRVLIEDAIESVILLLDEIDGDDECEEEPDAEDGGNDEPSLGSPSPGPQQNWAHGSGDD